MEIGFATQKLAKLCGSEAKLRGELGPRCAGLMRRRLDEMTAADCLDDLFLLPGARAHALRADRQGQFAVVLEHPLRLVFEADHEPLPTRPDGSIDPKQVTRVRILEIVDYH